MKAFLYLWQYLAKLFLEFRNVLDKSCRENQNTHFIFNKSSSLGDNLEKYGADKHVIW